MSEKRWRWGVLSTANIGRTRFIPALQSMSNVEVVAVASRNLEAAEVFAQECGIPRAYGSYQELLEQPDIDILYNPTPNHLHVPLSIQALEHGKHVLCEKPIALTTGELEQLVQAQQQYPLARVMEGFMYRFHPQWRYICALIRDQIIGEVTHVHSIFTYFNDDPQNVRNQDDLGGGGLLDIGCYCVDVAKMIFNGNPKSAQSHIDYDSNFGTDRLTTGLLEFERGTATLVCSTQTFPFQQVCIHGTQGRIEVDIPFNSASDEELRSIRIITQNGVEEKTFDQANAYALMAQEMQQAIEEQKPLPITLEDSMETMAIIDRLFCPNNDDSWGEAP
jgi:predicted dehydrogenase